MEINYVQNGVYLIPDLTLQPRIGSYGRFGQMRENFLREHRRGMYEEMRLMDTLHEHLMEIDAQANGMMETLEAQLLERNPLPRTDDTMLLTCHRNRIRDQAEEIVRSEMIYS
jgi:hypothetical protein